MPFKVEVSLADHPQFLELPGNFGYSDLHLFFPKFRQPAQTFAWLTGWCVAAVGQWLGVWCCQLYQYDNNNDDDNNGYFESLVHTGPKHVQILNKRILMTNIQTHIHMHAYKHAHRHMHTHTHTHTYTHTRTHTSIHIHTHILSLSHTSQGNGTKGKVSKRERVFAGRFERIDRGSMVDSSMLLFRVWFTNGSSLSVVLCSSILYLVCCAEKGFRWSKHAWLKINTHTHTHTHTQRLDSSRFLCHRIIDHIVFFDLCDSWSCIHVCVCM